MAGFSSGSTRFGGTRNHLTIQGVWVTLTAGVNKLVGDVGVRRGGGGALSAPEAHAGYETSEEGDVSIEPQTGCVL